MWWKNIPGRGNERSEWKESELRSDDIFWKKLSSRYFYKIYNVMSQFVFFYWTYKKYFLLFFLVILDNLYSVYFFNFFKHQNILFHHIDLRSSYRSEIYISMLANPKKIVLCPRESESQANTLPGISSSALNI